MNKCIYAKKVEIKIGWESVYKAKKIIVLMKCDGLNATNGGKDNEN